MLFKFSDVVILIVFWMYQSALEMGYKAPIVGDSMNNLDVARGSESVNSMNMVRAGESMNTINMARAGENMNSMNIPRVGGENMNVNRANESLNNMNLTRGADNMNMTRAAGENINISRLNESMNVARGGHLFQDDIDELVKRPQPSDTPKVKVSSHLTACHCCL